NVSTGERSSAFMSLFCHDHIAQPSVCLKTQRREMLDPARRDYQAVDARRVEHEAQRGFRHGLLSSVGRLPQPPDGGEALLTRLAGTDFRRPSEAAVGRSRLTEAIFAGQEPPREWAKRRITKPMAGAVGDQRLRI